MKLKTLQFRALILYFHQNGKGGREEGRERKKKKRKEEKKESRKERMYVKCM